MGGFLSFHSLVLKPSWTVSIPTIKNDFFFLILCLSKVPLAIFFILSPWQSNCREWCRNWPTESLTKCFPECVIRRHSARTHVWSAWEKSLEILHHNWELNPGYGEDDSEIHSFSHWAIVTDELSPFCHKPLMRIGLARDITGLSRLSPITLSQSTTPTGDK